MEVQSENRCPNPECDAAGDIEIEWQAIDICCGDGDPDFTKQRATCTKCGAKFTEYFKLVYQGTEYMPSYFKNIYNLYDTEDCTPKQHERCVDVTNAITAILQEAVEQAKNGQDTIDNGYFCCLVERIKMLIYARVGVGDTDTDECIASHYKGMLISGFLGSEAEGEKKAREFYRMIH